MSTKSSIFSNKDIHFYEECFDDDNVYIEVDGNDIVFINKFEDYFKITLKLDKKSFTEICKKHLALLEEND